MTCNLSVYRVKELKNHNDQLVEMNDLLKEELMNSEQISKALIGRFCHFLHLQTFQAGSLPASIVP